MNTDAGGDTIGIDLGGTHLRVARIDGAGHVAAACRVATDRSGPDAVVAQMAKLVAAVRGEQTRGIGIGVPGALDAASGTVLGIPALPGWGGVALAARLEAGTGLPCMLENDAKAAAIGEWYRGAAQGCDNFVYVTISTGIGSCAVVDGRLLRGAGGLAGEIGHTRITDSAEICACGLSGCWQAVASGPALGRRAAAAVAQQPGSALARIAGGAEASAVHVGAAAQAGDPLALALLTEHATLLGFGLANLQHVYAPERLVMGGGVSALLELMRADIERVLRARLLPGFAPAAILAAALGDDAGIVGAAEMARRRG